MVDVLVVLLVMAFFAVTVLYVRLCDRIVGPDPEPADLVGGEADPADPGDRAGVSAQEVAA